MAAFNDISPAYLTLKLLWILLLSLSHTQPTDGKTCNHPHIQTCCRFISWRKNSNIFLSFLHRNYFMKVRCSAIESVISPGFSMWEFFFAKATTAWGSELSASGKPPNGNLAQIFPI